MSSDAIEATYPPLDTPKEVAPGIWTVDGGPIRAMGIPLPVRMTVFRLSDASLLLHSPTRYSPELASRLSALGEIRYLVAPNIAHWVFLNGWQRALPDLRTWGVLGLARRAQVQRAGVRVDHELGASEPAEWSGEIEHVLVRGAGGFREVALFHIASRTLVLADLVQNLEPDKLPPSIRPLAKVAGVLAPNGRAPIYLRLAVLLKGSSSRDAGRTLVDLAPQRVIFSHGAWYEKDGAERLARSLAWLTRRRSGIGPRTGPGSPKA